MSRVIKFRFWNTIARRFQPSAKYAIDGNGKFIGYDYDTGSYDDPCDFSKTCIILSQFTGLLDKNGREIYEGDILRSINSEEGGEYIAEVKYNQDYCSFCNGEYALWCFGDKPEVIGNVFENKELIK